MQKFSQLFIGGYVKISVKGDQPIMFLQNCLKNHIAVWQIQILNENECIGHVRATDYKKILHMSNDLPIQVEQIEQKGLPFLLKNFLRKKEVLFAFIFAIVFLMFLSNILWNVSIEGVSEEAKMDIQKQLRQYGIRPGSLLFTIESPGMIQQQLLKDLPDLLWIGVEQKGTSLRIEGVEKNIIEEKETPPPRNLVATKKGVVKYMFIEKGVPMVSVNDYVEPGDLLVSGILKEENEENEQQENQTIELVASTGEVIAETWYEINMSVNFSREIEQLTGAYEEKYAIGIGEFNIPIWNFDKNVFRHFHEERDKRQIKFLRLNLPIHIQKTTIHEKVYNKIERSEEEAIAIGLEQMKRELKQQLGKNIVIQSEKILHQSRDNGKVNLTIFVTVEENIIKEEPIHQGD